ncbi:type II toxin-antitoxin system VapC family toxin [Georgenia sp. MJ173]|uniref:type II toxin-antitoxin system VapC family toxin n=1 Tax=Georgenia sunbinii TaxID=3117728 RepID=UPI002F263F5F
MRLLIDTHVLLWQLSKERPLTRATREAILAADDVLVSTVSFAEMGVKMSLGKLDVPPDLEKAVRTLGVRILGLSPAHGLAVGQLPIHHRDPFDRLIIAQAATDDLAVVTADRRFADYPITTIAAG